MSLADLLKSSQPTEAEKGNTQPATTGGGSLAQLLKESSPLDRASAVPTKTQELPSAQMVPDVQVPQKDAGGGVFDRYNKAVERKVGAFDAGALEGVSTIVSGFQWLAGQADIASLTSTEKRALDAIQVAQGAGKDTTKLVSSLNAAVQARTGFTDWYGDYAKKTGRIGDAAAKLNEWGDVLKKAGGITPQNQTFLDTLAEGAGSSVVYFAPGMGVARGAELMAAVSPRVALLFGNSAMTALESMSEAGNVYQTLKQSGKTDQQASEGATKDFLVNAVLISITNQLGITNPAKLGAIRRALLSAPVEGFQEAAQQLTQNITQGESDPWNGVLESGAIGTILGPFLGGAAGVLGGGEAGVAPDIAKKPGAQAPEPAPHPSTGATNETVAATIKLAADGPAAVRDEIQTLTLEQQLQPTNTEIAARLGSLQAQLQDYFDVAKETAIHSTEPLLQVDTLKLSGDKYGFSVSAQVDQNSFNIPIQASEVFATKEEAAQAALDAVKAWATTQKQSANATEAQPAYDALIEATKVEGKPQAQAVKNGSTAPVFDEAQQAKIEEHRAYFKLAFEEYNRLADENSDAPFPRLVGDLQEEAVRNLVEAGAIPADIAPFVEKEMAYLGPGAILDENATDFAARLGKKIVGNTGDVSAIPQRIKVAEEQLKDAYRRLGVTQDDQNMLKADEELSYILVEMLELSQAGYRYGDMNAPEGYVAVKSTFPQWVTEDLRSKKLFQAVFGGIGSINELHYPTGSRTKQRRLYQDVLDTLDARLHIDTSEVRGKIMTLYEQQAKDNEAAAEKRKGAANGGTRSTAGGEATATQADKVKEAVSKEAKSIKAVAAETGILEPNIRHILGVGEKEGTFTRVEKGVYILSKGGQDLAYIHAGDAVDTLPKLVKDGTKVDMVFLDIPYDTPAVKGGNRGAKYDLISVSDFKKVLASVSELVRTEDTPVFHMFSNAQSGFEKMQQYNDAFVGAGFKPVGKGQYQKTYKDGSPVAFPTVHGSKVVEPEGILVFNKSGEVRGKGFDNLDFKLVRPKGYQTEKPEEMLKKMIEMSTNEGDTVLDPFAGSGSTGAAAVKSGRKAILIEKDKNVVDTVTKPRIESAIGQIEAGDIKTPSGTAMAMYKAEDMPDFPVRMGGLNQTRAVEFPELVDIARELMGRVPDIVKKTGNAAGRFKARGGDTSSTRIVLVADLFKAGNLREAGKVLAHEIGHLVDYLPEGTLKRGNLLGRLHTLNNFMSEVFGSEGRMDTKAIRSQALKDTLNAEGVSWGQYMTDKAVRDRLKPLIKTRYNNAITESGGIRNSTVRNELLAVTRYWHPYDPAKVPESYKRYRESSKELYAEAVSMLFNSPGLLEQMAPTFYKQFFAALDEKPQVRDAYFKVQELMSGDREQLTRLRRAGVQKMFTEGDYKAGELNNKQHAEREARARDIRLRLRFELVDKNSRIIDLVSQLEDKGVHVNPDDNPVYYLEERNYLGGKIKGVMERDFNPIYQRVQDAGLAWSDLGELMFYQRIVAGDRSEQANPRGITPDAAKELIDNMRSQYGADGFKVLEQSAQDFRTAIKAIATEAYNEGLYTPELYQKMLDNPAYVTFQVIEHIEDGMSSRVYKSLGTLKDITNPADASLLKVIATLRAIERNKVHAKTIAMLEKHHPSEIQEAKYRWNGKSREPVRPKGRYQELVTVLKKGRLYGYYVDPYIQKSLDNESVGGNNAIIGTIRFFNSTTFRPLFITFNLGFQSFNLIRDFVRFYKNIPGMTLIRALRRYQQGSRMSRVRAFGVGKSAADQAEYAKLQKLEHDQILSVTFNDILTGYNEEEKQIERILRESGIDSFKPEEGSKVLKPIKAVLEKIEQLGNMIETLPKAAGYYEFTDQNGGEPISKEQASFIRKNIGSPDFLAGGNIKPATNEIFLFSNAITQGMRSDYNIATDPKTRSGFWWKTTKVTFLPKILMAAALAGAFGDAIKRIFEDASEYDMTNYTIVPVGTDANGKSVYVRIPVDESSRFLGGVLWKAMMAVTGQNQQSVGKNIMDIASYTGGQLPSLSPTLEVTSATLQYLGGANPYDAFKGRQVLSDQVYKAGGIESAKAYAGWVFQQLGGGVFVRFYYEPTTPEPASNAERVVNLPILGNIIGRFVRITDYGRQEKLKNIQKQTQSEEAQASLRERKLVNQYIANAQKQGLKLATSSLKADLVKEVLGHAPQTSDEVAHATRIKNKFDLGLKRGNASPEVTALIDADTNKQKVAILQQIHTTMSDSEWTDFKKQLLAQKIVSTTVLYDPSLR